jgi:signal transduction histidine kinase
VAGARQEEVDRLWLAAQQRLAEGVAHELRNALNGVAVNLEVVRSRAAREGTTGAALGGFASSAAEQLEQVIALTEALVVLGRPARQPAVVGRLADTVVALLRPPVLAGGGTLDLVVEGEGSTRVAADAARLLVAAALLAAVDAGKELRCRVRPGSGPGGSELAIEGRFAGPPRLAPEVERLAGSLDVAVRGDPSGITLTFPA